MRTGPLATAENGAVQRAAAADLRVLVAWMQLNGVFQFSHLGPDDIEQHMRDRAKGKEHCLNILARIEAVLKQYEGRPEAFTTAADIREAAGIDARDTNLPGAAKLLARFCARHRLERRVGPSKAKGRRMDGVASSSLRRIAGNIRRLWSLGSRLDGDRLSFDPFPDAGKSVAKSMGRPDARTPTAPTQQALTLIDRACRWVMEVGPQLLDLRDEIESYERQYPHNLKYGADADVFPALVEGAFDKFNAHVSQIAFPQSLVRSHLRREAGDDLLFRRAVNGFLPTACAIVIAAFTARRHMEILTLEEGAISGNSQAGYWLVSYIEKTLRKVDATPCPAIVAEAVKLLERWNAPARAKSGTKRLFKTPIYTTESDYKQFRLEYYLNEFANFVQIPDQADGTQWHFAPHQFRRFFAILYVWRFECGDLGALSHHLRHFNIEMTRRYVTDIEMGRVIHEEGRSYTVDKLMTIAHGDRKAVGPMGKRLQRHVERLRKSVEISSDRDLKRKLERLVETLGLSVRGTPWGYCGSRNTAPARRRANCQQPEWKGRSQTYDGFPDPGGSTETACSGCIHNMVDELRKPRWDSEIKQIDAALASPNLPDIAAAALQDRRAKIAGYSRLLAEAN